MPEKRLRATVDRAVWEKITKKGRAGIRWDNEVEKMWKYLGGDQEEVPSKEKFGGYKTELKEIIEERERQARRKKVNEKHFWRYRGVEGRYWNENVSARPNELHEKAETTISCGGPGPTRKKKEIPQVVGRRRMWLQICARVALQEGVGLT